MILSFSNSYGTLDLSYLYVSEGQRTAFNQALSKLASGQIIGGSLLDTDKFVPLSFNRVSRIDLDDFLEFYLDFANKSARTFTYTDTNLSTSYLARFWGSSPNVVSDECGLYFSFNIVLRKE